MSCKNIFENFVCFQIGIIPLWLYDQWSLKNNYYLFFLKTSKSFRAHLEACLLFFYLAGSKTLQLCPSPDECNFHKTGQASNIHETKIWWLSTAMFSLFTRQITTNFLCTKCTSYVQLTCFLYTVNIPTQKIVLCIFAEKNVVRHFLLKDNWPQLCTFAINWTLPFYWQHKDTNYIGQKVYISNNIAYYVQGNV